MFRRIQTGEKCPGLVHGDDVSYLYLLVVDDKHATTVTRVCFNPKCGAGTVRAAVSRTPSEARAYRAVAATMLLSLLTLVVSLLTLVAR